MALIDWLTRFLRGNKDAPMPLEPSERELVGLDIAGALEAHLKWRSRLEAYIAGNSTESLDTNVIQRDDQCILGKWIHGAGGTALRFIPEFMNLQRSHAEFHIFASRIVYMHGRGETEMAKTLLKSDFVVFSGNVQKTLVELQIAHSRLGVQVVGRA